MSDEWPGRLGMSMCADASPPPAMRRVVIESPYAGDVERHLRYLRACLLDCLDRGEAPIASHGLLPQVLDDADPDQRARGIAAGLTWHAVADVVACYVDLGWSAGMAHAEAHAYVCGCRVEIRRLGGEWTQGV